MTLPSRWLLATTLAAFLVAGCDDDGGTGTRPDAPARDPALELRFDRLVVEARRIEVSAVRPAAQRDGALTFPVTRRDGQVRRLGGTLLFTARFGSASFGDLRTDGDVISASVGGRRLPVLRFLAPPALVTEGTTVVLTEDGASRLDAAFSTDQFVEGQDVGRASLTGG